MAAAHLLPSDERPGVTHEFEDPGPPQRVEDPTALTRETLREGTVRVEKGPDVAPPGEWGFGLEPTLLALPKGAMTVYRDQRGTQSVQVREYEDYYLVQLDHANPEQGRVIEHLRRDVAPRHRGPLLAAGLIVTVVIAVLWWMLSG